MPGKINKNKRYISRDCSKCGEKVESLVSCFTANVPTCVSERPSWQTVMGKTPSGRMVKPMAGVWGLWGRVLLTCDAQTRQFSTKPKGCQRSCLTHVPLCSLTHVPLCFTHLTPLTCFTSCWQSQCYSECHAEKPSDEHRYSLKQLRPRLRQVATPEGCLRYAPKGTQLRWMSRFLRKHWLRVPANEADVS